MFTLIHITTNRPSSTPPHFTPYHSSPHPHALSSTSPSTFPHSYFLASHKSFTHASYPRPTSSFSSPSTFSFLLLLLCTYLLPHCSLFLRPAPLNCYPSGFKLTHLPNLTLIFLFSPPSLSQASQGEEIIETRQYIQFPACHSGQGG